MSGARIEHPDCLRDSYERLGWLERLVEQARVVLEDFERQPRYDEVFVERRVVGDLTHVRLRLASPVKVNPDLGFLISDAAVNARACLDMAITQLVAESGGEVRNAQFPILDDLDRWGGSDRLTSGLDKALAPQIVEVLKTLQPKHDTEFGFLDIPFNMIALVIRAVANANKHRNVTPVVHAVVASGVKAGASPVAPVYGHDSAWGDTAESVLELSFPSDLLLSDQTIVESAYARFDLQIENSQFHYGGDEKTYVVDFGYEIPIRVVGFLHDVPRFVRHALDGFAWALTEGVHGRQVSPYIEWWDSLN